MTGLRNIASVACSVALVSSAAYAADATRTRNNFSNSASLPTAVPSGQPANAAPATAEPTSYSEYMRLIKDGGTVKGGPLLLGTAKLQPELSRPKSLAPGGKNGGGECERVPFPCGVYEDATLFEAEQGPFSEVLGNLEDYEATNVGAGTLCVVGAPPLDCQRHDDPSGVFCVADAVDAGDVQQGLNQINSPFRNTDNEILLIGPGFSGNSSKYTLPNYFGDSHDITFPNLATLPGPCDNPATAPNVYGVDLVHPFGSTGAIVTVTLENGRTQEITTGRVPATGLFIGFCCEAPIQKVSVLDVDGLSIGTDNTKFGQNKAACPVSFPPVSGEDILCAIELIEAKLDSGVGGSGGGCGFCEAEIDAVADAGAKARLRHRRNQACKAEVNGHYQEAAHHRCQMQSEIDAQEGNGSITAAEATDLRDCTQAEQDNRSDDPCN